MKIENRKTIYESFSEFFMDLMSNKTDSLRSRLPRYMKSIFRGERSVGDDFLLLPKLFRKSECQDIIKKSQLAEFLKSDNREGDDEFAFVILEYNAFREFYMLANTEGLKLPNISVFQNSGMGSLPLQFFNKDEPIEWYSDEIAPLAALVQHYGGYTRMLDWTYSIFVAIYFASLDAIKNSVKEEKYPIGDFMRIWVLDSEIIDILMARKDNPNNVLRTVVPSYYENPNLGAQKGLLTYWRITADSIDDLGKMKPNLDPLNKRILSLGNEVSGLPYIYELWIPREDCFLAYQCVIRLGYTTAHLFPGYEGVMKQTEDDVIVHEYLKNLPKEHKNMEK